MQGFTAQLARVITKVTIIKYWKPQDFMPDAKKKTNEPIE